MSDPTEAPSAAATPPGGAGVARSEAAAASVWVGIALAAGGAVAFSGKAIIAKLAYRHGVDAITLVMYRMLFALPLFLALAWWAGRGRPKLTAADWRHIVLLGFSGYYLASTLDFMGLQYISASLERLILYLTPTIVLLLGVFLHQQKVKPKQVVALAVSYAGALLVFGHEAARVLWPAAGTEAAAADSAARTALGAALVLGSAISYAFYLSHSGVVLQRLGALRLTGLASSVACGLCILQFLLLRPLSAADVAAPVLWLSVLNAVACTFAPVMMIMLAIQRVGAAVTAQTGMIGPLSTIALGVMLLGEPLNAWIVAGTAAVLLGVGLLARAR